MKELPENPTILLKLAVKCCNKRRYILAHWFILLKLKLNPNDYFTMCWYAYILYFLRYYKKAEKYYLKAIESKPNEPLAHVGIGRIHYYNVLKKYDDYKLFPGWDLLDDEYSNKERAKEEFEKAIEHVSSIEEKVEISHMLAACSCMISLDNGIEAYKKILTYDPDDIITHYILGNIYTEFYNRTRTFHPDSCKGKNYYNNKNFAIQEYLYLFEKAPELAQKLKSTLEDFDIKVENIRNQKFYEQKLLVELQEKFTKMSLSSRRYSIIEFCKEIIKNYEEKELKLFYNMDIVYREIGVAFREKEQIYDSLEYLNKATIIGKTDYKNYLELGKTYFEIGNYPNAIECYETSIKLYNNLNKSYAEIAIAYCKMKKYNKAIRYAKVALMKSLEKEKIRKLLIDIVSIDENNAFAYRLLAEDKEYNSNEEMAKKYYKKAIEVNPNYYKAYIKYANFLINNRHTNEFDIEIEQLLKTAIKLKEKSTEAYFLLAKHYDQVHAIDAALKYYHKVVEMDNKKAIVYYYISKIYEEKGDYKISDKFFNKAKDLNPAIMLNDSVSSRHWSKSSGKSIDFFHFLI